MLEYLIFYLNNAQRKRSIALAECRQFPEMAPRVPVIAFRKNEARFLQINNISLEAVMAVRNGHIKKYILH